MLLCYFDPLEKTIWIYLKYNNTRICIIFTEFISLSLSLSIFIISNDKIINIDKHINMYKHNNIIINEIRNEWMLDLCELIFN